VGEANLYNLCDFGEQYLLKGENLAFWYMWHRWDPGNELGVWSSSGVFGVIDNYLYYHLAQQTYWWRYDPWNLAEGDRLQDSLHRPLWDPADPDYLPYGTSSPVFPGLMNRNAPDHTIITRCSKHRASTEVFYGEDEEGNAIVSARDIALRLDGSARLLVGLAYVWAVQPPYEQ
jgi:hypothetical protein